MKEHNFLSSSAHCRSVEIDAQGRLSSGSKTSGSFSSLLSIPTSASKQRNYPFKNVFLLLLEMLSNQKSNLPSTADSLSCPRRICDYSLMSSSSDDCHRLVSFPVAPPRLNLRDVVGQAHRILNVYSTMGLVKSPGGMGQHSKGSTSVPPDPNEGSSEIKMTLTMAKGTTPAPAVPPPPIFRHPAVMVGLLGTQPGSLIRLVQFVSNPPLVEPLGWK